jgi:carbon storage regulator
VLVVRRRAGELIRIGQDVELRLLSIGKNSVRLGIEAPRSVTITVRQTETEEAEKKSNSDRSVETSGQA